MRHPAPDETVLSVCTWKHTPMAKPVRYPAKLRKRLEEIAAKREAREAEGDDANVDFANTFYRAFLPEQSVFGVYASIDEVLRRATMNMILQPEFRARARRPSTTVEG